MYTLSKNLGLYICLLGISGCMIDGATSSNTTIPMPAGNNSSLYPESYENPVQYSLPNTSINPDEPVIIPQAFHIS